jgi:peptidyl-prolyl cis-trans isomerase C
MKSYFRPIFLAALATMGGATAAFAQQSNAPAAKPVEQKPAETKPAEAKAAVPVKAPKVSVNGVTIPEHRFDLMLKQAMSQGQQQTPELMNNIKETLIRGEMVAQEAAKAGLDKTPDVQSRMDMFRQQILYAAYLQEYIKKNPITEEKIKAEYDSKIKSVGEKEYKAQHVLVEKEAEAKDIIAQLKKGGDFAKLAKEKSKDTGSKENGGKLDWSTPNMFVKEFSDAMAKLKKGDYTAEPVKTQFGYHVIKLEDARAAKAPPYDEVKERIRQNQTQEAANKVLQELRAKAKVEEKP